MAPPMAKRKLPVNKAKFGVWIVRDKPACAKKLCQEGRVLAAVGIDACRTSKESTSLRQLYSEAREYVDRGEIPSAQFCLENFFASTGAHQDRTPPPKVESPSLDNPQFLLSRIHILNGRLQELQGDRPSAQKAYETSLKSADNAEAHLLLAKLLRPDADTESALDDVETHLRRAITISEQVAEHQAQNSISTDVEECVSRELEQGELALERLALLLCQDGTREKEATKNLLRLGFEYRLSPHVLHYEAKASKSEPSSLSESSSFIKVIDDALHPLQLSHLQSVFAPGATFWREHGYNEFESNGYFSYIQPLQTSTEPRNTIEQIVTNVFSLVEQHFPNQAKMITVAEWWAHCRPHSSGHQLHFDSENEGQGGVRHPLISTVVYLSEEDANATIGFGPTLMTDQSLEGGMLATKGWLAYPKVNRLTMFNAKYLHGVIPGRGPTTSNSTWRISFMIGFWDKITARPREDGKPGASQPFPSPTSTYTWLRELQPVLDSSVTSPDRPKQHQLVIPRRIPTVWEAVVKPSGGRRRGGGVPSYEVCFQGF